MLRDPEREVVVTGAGVCCHMGDDLEDILGRLRSGRNLPIPAWPPVVELNARCQLTGIYPGDLSDEALGLQKKQARFMGRASRLALHAARKALAASGRDPADLAVVVGSGTGDVDTHREVYQRLDKSGDTRRVAPTTIPRLMASTVAANLVNVLCTSGLSFTPSAACAGGAYSLLLAAQMIELGHAEAALAGGVESSDVHFFAGFDAMRAFNPVKHDDGRASRPYAADREGFVFSEGAGVVVLETRAAAEARGATILGTLLGYGMSSDGKGEMVAPDEEGARAAITRALRHAGLSADQIDYVNTHGTSTPVGDVSEVRALRGVFGDRHVRYSSTKGYTGHTISAAGAIEAIFTLHMLREGWVAPSVSCDPLDPALEDYPPVRQPTDAELRYALSNSFGFGGTNACLALGRA